MGILAKKSIISKNLDEEKYNLAKSDHDFKYVYCYRVVGLESQRIVVFRMPVQNNDTNISELEEKLKIVVDFQERHSYLGLLTWLISNEKIMLSYLYDNEGLNIDQMLADLNTLFLDTNLDEYGCCANFNYAIAVPDPDCYFSYKVVFTLNKHPDFV